MQNQPCGLHLDSRISTVITAILLGRSIAKASTKTERAYQQAELEMRGCSTCSLQQNCRKERANENITIQGLQRIASLPYAEIIAKVLGISPASSYELMHESGFPVLKIGSRTVVPKGKFIAWVEQNTAGGKAP